MRVAKDISGHRLGSLLVVKIDDNRDSESRSRAKKKWICQCDCGKVKSFFETNLLRGLSTTCGCSKGRKPTHGLRHKRAYTSWHTMIRRCEDVNCNGYENYSARGITVCEEWHDIEKFYADMGERPEGTSIDRIDNNKGYYKDNCRWATAREQSLNKSSNRHISFNGMTKTITEWSEHFGIKRAFLNDKLRSGMPFEDIVKVVQVGAK